MIKCLFHIASELTYAVLIVLSLSCTLSIYFCTYVCVYVYTHTILFSLHGEHLELSNKKELSGLSLSNITALVKKIEFQGSYNLPKILYLFMTITPEPIKYQFILIAK